MKRRKASNFLFYVLFVAVIIFPFSSVFAEGPISVEITGDKVNLLTENRTFGEVFDMLSRKAQFGVTLPSELRSKRISIISNGLDVDRTIVRLFTLVQEKNYKIKYDSSGKVLRVEIIDEKKFTDEQGHKGGRDTIRGREGSEMKSVTTPGRTLNRPTRRYRPQYVRPRVPQQHRPVDDDLQSPPESPAEESPEAFEAPTEGHNQVSE